LRSIAIELLSRTLLTSFLVSFVGKLNYDVLWTVRFVAKSFWHLLQNHWNINHLSKEQ